MEDSLHYLIMANRMLVQRGLLERLKNTGLTIGQPKVLDYLKDHDGSSQKEIAAYLNRDSERKFTVEQANTLADLKFFSESDIAEI